MCILEETLVVLCVYTLLNVMELLNTVKEVLHTVVNVILKRTHNKLY